MRGAVVGVATLWWENKEYGMENKTKLAVIGGDFRQIALIKYLCECGYGVSAFGVPDAVLPSDAVEICEDWKKAVQGAAAVILPIPVSSDRIHISCPIKTACSVSCQELMDSMAIGAVLMGGKIGEPFVTMARERGIEVFDYGEDEAFQIKNALSTAEGAIAVAMGELPITLFGARVAVTGYGRIAKLLSGALLALGAHVTVAARKAEDLAWASLAGCQTVRLGGEGEAASLCYGQDIIFNTVPAKIFDETFLSKLDTHTLVIDLASRPGGVDVAAANRHGVRVIWALSLPGKYSPVSAGRYIGESAVAFLSGKRRN